MTAKRFNAGDRVRLTGKFLRSIGSSDAYQTWEVMPCACRFCAQHYLVLTDELTGSTQTVYVISWRSTWRSVPT